MSIRQRNAHFTDWAAVCKALHVNTESEARAALESSDNTFYYYVCYIKSTKEIYTHGQIYSCSGNDDLLDLINELTAEVVENEEVTAKALSDLNENKASRGEVEMFATSKQDKITDLDSIRTKANNAVQPDQISNFVSATDLAKVATTGNYNDLLNVPDILTTEDVHPVCYTGNYDDLNNKPTIPDAQVNSDWNATSGKAQILNKPTIPAEVLESTVSNWGFTKNLGTVTSIKINGATKNSTSGVIDLGTVLTSYTPMNLSTSDNSPTTLRWSPNQKYAYTGTSSSGTVTFTMDLSSINVQKDNTWCLSFMTGSTVPTINFGVAQTGYTIMWANGVAPAFEENTFYELTFKLVGTYLLGVYGAFKTA